MADKLLRSNIGYAAFWLAIVVFIFFFPVVIGRQSLTETVPAFYSSPSPAPPVPIPWQVDAGTHAIQTIPFVEAGIRMIKNGIAPLWAPYAGGGQPLASDVASGLYYPLRLVFFLIWDSPRAFDWYFLLRFFIAGLGMFMYLRIIGLRRIVALWGGIAYAFTGYFILYLTYPFLDIDALLPWILFAIERYFLSPSLRSSALIGLLLAMIVMIGQPQSTIIATLLIVLYFLSRAVQQRSRAQWRAAIRYGLFVVVVAGAVASPFISDFLAAYGQGTTIDNWQTKGLTNFPPVLLLHFIVTPSAMPEVALSGHLFDRYQFIIPYVGMSVLTLFLLSLFLKKKLFPLLPLYAWITFVILKNAGFPLVQWIGALPILNQIGWYKAYGPMASAMIICAAIALEYILREHEEGDAIRWRSFYKFLGAIPVAFVAAYVLARSAFLKAYVPNFDFANRQPEMIEKVTAILERFPSKIKEFILDALQNHGEYFTAFLFIEAVVFTTIALIIIHHLRRKQQRRYVIVMMILLTGFELWFYMPKIRDGFRYLDPYRESPPYVSFLENRMEKEGVSRTFSVGNVFHGYLGELYAIQQSQHNGAIKSRRYLSFLPNVILQDDPLTSIIPAGTLGKIPIKFFDAYNIRYLISEESLDPKLGFRFIYDEDMKIYENSSALPKAYVSFEKRTAGSPEEARILFYSPSFDPHVSVILEDKNSISLSPADAGPEDLADAVVTSYEPNRITLRAESGRDGVLVLSELFYPGWNAYLDGKKVQTYPANVMFRGVFLPAGAHTVTFRFEPWWFSPSVAVSLFTLAGVLGAFLYPRIRKSFHPENAADISSA